MQGSTCRHWNTRKGLEHYQQDIDKSGFYKHLKDDVLMFLFLLL